MEKYQIKDVKDLKGKKVFLTSNGNTIVAHFLWTKLNRILQREGFRHIRVHDLRHSCASFYLSQGADMYAIQRLLGHASIDETIRTYSHFSPQQDRQIANLVNALNQKNTSG